MLDAGEQSSESKARVHSLLDRFSIEDEAIRLLTHSLARMTNTTPRSLRAHLALVRSLASSTQRRAKLVAVGIVRKLAETLRLNHADCYDPPTPADLELAATAVCRCAYSPELRSAIRSAGAESALHAAAASLSPDDDSEGADRLRRSTNQALSALAGELDASAEKSRIAQTLFLSGSASDVALREDSLETLQCLPTFHVFLSHKRTSAQDFARTLHSVIVGKGFSCFLDVENLDKIDELSLIVAGVFRHVWHLCRQFVSMCACV